jgi:hypothetical protein
VAKSQTAQNPGIPPANPVFRWGIIFLNGLLLMPFWWYLAQIFVKEELGTQVLVKTAVGFLVWIALMVLTLLTFQGYRRQLISAWVLGLLTLFLFFPWDPVLLGALGIALGALLVLKARLKLELELSTKLLLRRLLPRALPFFFTLLALAIALIYFSSPLIDKGINLQLPRPLFDIAISSMPFSQKLQTLGISEELLYEQVNQQFQLLVQPYQEIIPLFFVLGVALTLKAFSYPFIWLLVLLEGALLRLLIRLGLVCKEIRKVDKETFHI